MNLFLHGIEDLDVVRGDSLAQRAFLEGDSLRQFDISLANPPYSIPLYVKRQSTADDETIDLPTAVTAWRNSSTQLCAAASELLDLLAKDHD